MSLFVMGTPVPTSPTEDPEPHPEGMDEVVGAAIFRAAGLRLDAPPAEGAFRIAAELYGGDCIVMSERAQVDAAPAHYGGAQRIVLAPRLSLQRSHFAVARMIARIEIPKLGIAADEERVAAFLVAPPRVFAARVADVGLDLGELADNFVVTQTCAALRVVEVGARDGVVVTPSRVHRPGRLLGWADDAAARAIARRVAPRSVRKVAIRDEPGRIALYRAAE